MNLLKIKDSTDNAKVVTSWWNTRVKLKVTNGDLAYARLFVDDDSKLTFSTLLLHYNREFIVDVKSLFAYLGTYECMNTPYKVIIYVSVENFDNFEELFAINKQAIGSKFTAFLSKYKDTILKDFYFSSEDPIGFYYNKSFSWTKDEDLIVLRKSSLRLFENVKHVLDSFFNYDFNLEVANVEHEGNIRFSANLKDWFLLGVGKYINA